MNVLLGCIPIAFVLVYAPKIGVSIAMGRQPEGYDNKSPRDQQARLTGWGKRASAAHANGFESFPAFAVGALVAHVTNASPKAAAALGITYVVARTLYPLLYIANIDKLRSLVWFAGFVASVGLMALPLFS
jgi:uncharacterized MAPEG superfamily protein